MVEENDAVHCTFLISQNECIVTDRGNGLWIEWKNPPDVNDWIELYCARDLSASPSQT